MELAVADVISRIESDNNQYAQRFEKLHLGVTKPSVLTRIINAHGGPGRISRNTADCYASMSHGMFQLMGFNLYGDKLGHTKPLWSFMNDKALQRETFERYRILWGLQMFTVSDLKYDSVKREHFAREYNGPNNVADYGAKILVAIAALEKL